VGDSDAVHLNKANGVTVNSTVLTATYDKGLYTYEFSDSVFVLFYIVPYEGAERIYAPIRERNLSELVNARKDDTDDFGPEERTVYAHMALLEDHILDYRSDFPEAEKEPAFNVPTLATNPLSGTRASSSSYKFGHTVQIKLIEPWGMKINARVYTNGMTSSQSIDYSTLQDYGCIVVQSDTKLTTVDEMLAKDGAYHFSKSNGCCDVAGNVITAKFYKDIYTYQLDHKLYVVFYVKDANGYHFGDVKERVLLDLMDTRKDQSNGDYTVKERLVYADMVNLYDAVWAYRNDLNN
jgi:hypothetical protein